MSVCDERFQRLDALAIARRLAPDSIDRQGTAEIEAPTKAARESPTALRDSRWLEIAERYGFTVAQLADFVGRSAGTVKDGLRRARAAREAEQGESGLTPRQRREVRSMYAQCNDPNVKAFLSDPTPGWRERSEAKKHAGTQAKAGRVD